MPAADLSLLIDAAREAGQIARRYFGQAEAWDKPGGAGPVTEADLAVNAMLHAQLQQARPDYGWLSEETPDDANRLRHERVFIVDPIDGTRSFIQGSSTWAHSLAIAENGRVIAAAVYLPMREKMYTAATGQGADLNGSPIRASDRSAITGATLLSAKATYDPKFWQGPVPGFERHYRPSLAYRLALVAEGRFDAMLTLRASWEWDIAAGDLILLESGAITSDMKGNQLLFNNPTPQVNGVIAGGKNLHQHIASALR